MGANAAATLWREVEGKKRSIGVRRGMLETFFLEHPASSFGEGFRIYAPWW